MSDPTDPTTTRLNPYPVGSPEHAEWQEIAAAPAWHDRPRHARRVALAALAEGRGSDDARVSLNLVDVAGAEALANAGIIFGPDVSQYQGRPAWATVKASGCRLKFWKVSEGYTFEDPSNPYNSTPTAGMVEACYHFLYFSQQYVDKPALWGAQADNFARLARADVGHVLDVEAAATAGHWLGVKEWAAEYRKLFPGHPLGGYLNRSLWRNRSRMPYDPAGIFDYIWHAGIGDGYYTSATGSISAQWAGTSSLANSVAAMGFPDVKLWQITDHAAVPGVSGTCDGNAFQGSAADLTALLTKGTVDDSMSAQDVADLKAYLGSDAFAGQIKAAVHNTPIGKLQHPDGTPVTLGEIADATWRALPNVDELSPAAVAAVAGAVTPGVVSGVQAAIGTGQGGQLTRADVGAALADALGNVRLSAEAPPAGA